MHIWSGIVENVFTLRVTFFANKVYEIKQSASSNHLFSTDS